MKKFSFFLLAFLTTAAHSILAWDFAPKEARTFVDGPAPRHYYFQKDDRKVNFRVDVLSKVTGTAATTEINFTDLKYATLKVAKSPLQQKQLPFEKNLPVYQAAALALLPAGSTDIVLQGESDNVFPINDWTSHQYTYQYAYYGRTIRTSLTFLNYSAKDQWIINISSIPEDFEKATARASRVLNSFDETALDVKLEDLPN